MGYGRLGGPVVAQHGLACAPLVLLVACAAPLDREQAPEPAPVPSTVAEVPAWVPVLQPAPLLSGECAAVSVVVPPAWPSLEMGAAHVSGLAVEQAGFLDPAGRTSLMDLVRDHPARADCVAEHLERAVQVALDGPAPVAALVRLGARALDAPVAADVPMPAADFEAALARLCAESGGCADGPAPSPQMQSVLSPVLVALADLLRVQGARFESDPRGEAWWRSHGANLTLIGPTRPNPGYAQDRAVLLADRGRLYAATQRLARTLELARWRDLEGAYYLETGLGRIEVAGRGSDVHAAPALLRVDLGGDDVYFDAASGAVQVLVDLGGDDLYTYSEAEGASGPEAMPADDGGRGDSDGLAVQVSLSQHARQGGAHAGVSLHLDLGGGADRYRTLRGGQGYAHLGVGVLFDDGGDDEYWAEDGAQGAATFGIGLLVDVGGGADRYAALHASQGFAGPGGFGALIDDGGADHYRCLATPARHPAPQAEEVNASFCQGASQGFRAQAADQSLSGGFGLLYDARGDDTYEAAVFGQGVGYWRGAGLLVDAAGDDRYLHHWYGAGAGVHFGTGALVDGAGDDRYGDPRSAHMALGAGHHFGVGALFDVTGDDHYTLPTFGGGAATCGSLGLFVDVEGADTYRADRRTALGVATVGGCDERGERITRALFRDLGGRDRYPLAVPGAGDGRAWGQAETGDPTELAAGIDAAEPAP